MLQLRFALSLDTQLTEQGDKTSINYHKDFNTYLSLLKDGLRNKSPPILALFDEWDRVVFGRKESRFGVQTQSADDADRDELERIHAQMLARVPVRGGTDNNGTVNGEQEQFVPGPDEQDEICNDPEAAEDEEMEEQPLGTTTRKANKRVVGSDVESEDEHD